MKKNLEVYNSSEQEFDLGIISYNLNTKSGNYGALLHSFAFQKYLDKRGIKSVIISYSPYMFWNFIRKVVFSNIPFGFIRSIFIIIKTHMFSNFYKKNNCVFTKNKYNHKNAETLENIKRYCCETDVTWQCTKRGYKRFFMCDYSNMKNKDNIAYSVDTGSQDVPQERIEELKNYSKNFKYISIRHLNKLDEFKKTINRDDVVVTLDPVFLLDEKDYLQYFDDKKPKHDYVFVYNCKEYNSSMIEQAKRFAKENNYKIKIINCCDTKCKHGYEKIPTLETPENFLKYLKNSKYVFTNSYHAICFSIIFKKDFFAFQRGSNDEKIKTILNISGLNNRLIENGIFSQTKINYNEVEAKMQPMIDFSKNWLNEALI